MAREKLFFSATILPKQPGHEPRRVSVLGRQAWALLELVEAGANGCTPITHPGPRWSDYVFKLRKDGFSIETINEGHGGPFAGTHAKYLLHDIVRLEGGNLEHWRPNGVKYPATARQAA